MSVLPIRIMGDPGLREKARPVETFDRSLKRLARDMVETMYAAPGVGLAAPQVGVPRRVIVLDIDHDNPGKTVYKLINPVVTHAEGEVVWEEGCLSVVDFTAEVRRSAKVEVVAFNENQKEVKIEAEGLLAVALQHEIDHLDGKLFIDRISRLKRELYTRRRKKMLRSGIPPAGESPHVMI